MLIRGSYGLLLKALPLLVFGMVVVIGGGLSITVITLLVFGVFLLSLKYGSSNITKHDTIILIFSLSAVVVWWQLDNPIMAVIMVSAIDALGYIPTYRKSFENPWTENINFWFLMTCTAALSIIANAEYNVLTVTYLATLMSANIILLAILITRRRRVPQQK